MDKELISTFKFLNYVLSDIDFKINKEVHFNKTTDFEVDLGFGIDIGIQADDPNQVLLSVTVDIFRNYIEEGYPFYLHFVVDAFFEIENGMSENDVINFCKTSGMPILFPYIRAAVTDITKTANIEPLVLPLINIRKIAEDPSLIKEN